jgi:hypothetical protein
MIAIHQVPSNLLKGKVKDRRKRDLGSDQKVVKRSYQQRHGEVCQPGGSSRGPAMSLHRLQESYPGSGVTESHPTADVRRTDARLAEK